MVKCMKLLGNLLRGINPIQKHLLYRCCILSIVLYRFQLWFYNKAPLSYPMKILGKIQRRAAIWILGAFRTLLVDGLKAITSLIPIKFHLQKLVSRSQLRSAALPENYLIRTFMEMRPAMALRPSVGNVLKASSIQMVALLCIFLRIFMGYDRGAMLSHGFISVDD